MPQTNLKVMVDEDLFGKEILAALHQLGSAIDVKTIVECDFPTGTKDKTLVAATESKRRILLTANYNDINEHKYKPCSHGGIILIDHPNPSAEVVRSRLKAFCQSGKRSQAKGHVTYLGAEKYVIHKLHREKIEEEYHEKKSGRVARGSKRIR